MHGGVLNDESSNCVEKMVVVFTAANLSASNKKRTYNACNIILPERINSAEIFRNVFDFDLL